MIVSTIARLRGNFIGTLNRTPTQVVAMLISSGGIARALIVSLRAEHINKTACVYAALMLCLSVCRSLARGTTGIPKD